jgi:hypothetical protein
MVGFEAATREKDAIGESLRALRVVDESDGGVDEQLRRRWQRIRGDIDLKPSWPTPSVPRSTCTTPIERVGRESTGYVTRVHDYIDAQRCDFGQCSRANLTATDSFVFLQYANDSALLHGVDYPVIGSWDGPIASAASLRQVR